MSETFARGQQTLDDGRTIDEGRSRYRSILARLTDGLWQTVVKAAAGGRELILSSLLAAKPRDVARAARKAAKVKK